MAFTTFFIDLDETVYPTSCGVWDAISGRMNQYMQEHLGYPQDGIDALRHSLYLQYGTTLRGLKHTTQVDERDFLNFVHDIPLDRLLQPDPGLKDILKQYPQRKIILTNADRNHALRVINRLQIEDCFDRVIDIYDFFPNCKPMPEAFHTALRLAGDPPVEACVFIDDSLHNLATARELGFFTIRVGSEETSPHCHASIARLSDLPRILPVSVP